MEPPSSKPWKKPKPKAATSTKLTPASIKKARAAAAKAGRKYPNLVDNMNAARQQKARSRPAAGRKRP